MSGINDDNEGINARSMSGINHSSGDVYLNGDPNAFTGTNTFNVNRPTSTITTTPGSTDFITKQNADALYTGAGSGGDVTKAGTNAFTGTNTFNVNRPTSTVATTPGSTDFITTQNADALYAPISVNGDVTEAGTNAFTGTNTFNTNRPTSTVATTPSSTDLITKQNADALYAPISVNGDVTESGDNDFTGANTFNTSRPTSTLATTPSNNDFITKSDGDTLYGGGGGDALLAGGTIATPQTFTGVNKFTQDIEMDGTDHSPAEFKQTAATTNQITQTTSTTNSTNEFIQTARTNNIEQDGDNTGTGENNIHQRYAPSDIRQEYNGVNIISQAGTAQFTQSGASSTISQTGTGSYITQSNTNSQIRQTNGSGSSISTLGRLWVGANGNPAFPLRVSASVYGANAGIGSNSYFTYMRHHSSGVHRAKGWNNDYFSAWFKDAMIGEAYVLASDRRIKKDINDISGATEIINKLKPVSYKYKDPKKDYGVTYGFIAQEVEEHLPTIVSTSNHIIPNILQIADVSNEIFTLNDGVELIEGETISIYDEANKEDEIKITEVIDDKNFKVDLPVEELKDKYFIYGKEVNDFKTINTDCLTAIMMKSIQELTARVKELEEKCV